MVNNIVIGTKKELKKEAEAVGHVEKIFHYYKASKEKPEYGKTKQTNYRNVISVER